VALNCTAAISCSDRRQGCVPLLMLFRRAGSSINLFLSPFFRWLQGELPGKSGRWYGPRGTNCQTISGTQILSSGGAPSGNILLSVLGSNGLSRREGNCPLRDFGMLTDALRRLFIEGVLAGHNSTATAFLLKAFSSSAGNGRSSRLLCFGWIGDIFRLVQVMACLPEAGRNYHNSCRFFRVFEVFGVMRLVDRGGSLHDFNPYIGWCSRA